MVLIGEAAAYLFFVPIGESKPKRGFSSIRKDKDEKYEMVNIGMDQEAFAHRF